MTETQFFTCKCDRNDHVIRIDFDDRDREVTLSVQMNPYMPLHRRVWSALKFVLGVKSHDSHWDTALLSEEEGLRLHGMLNVFYARLASNKALDYSRRQEQTERKIKALWDLADEHDTKDWENK